MIEDEFPSSASGRRKAAIEWWTRLDSRALSSEERREFAVWLAQDPANLEAFEDICRLWGDLERLRPIVAGLAPPPRSRARFFRAASAAMISAAALACFVFANDIWIYFRAQMRTGVAQTRTVDLADGSRIELGPRSAISVDFDSLKRNVVLLEGEAWFDVAPDAARPFSVLVGGGAVTALGTSFNVSTEAGRTEVTVAKHRVRVTAGGPAVVVSEGEQSAFAPGAAAIAPYPAQIDHVAAWRRGKLIFDDKPLDEVVSILGHYRRGVIVLLGSSIRERRVSGVFDATQPMAALRAIEKALGLRAIDLGYFIALTG